MALIARTGSLLLHCWRSSDSVRQPQKYRSHIDYLLFPAEPVRADGYVDFQGDIQLDRGGHVLAYPLGVCIGLGGRQLEDQLVVDL